MAKRIEADEMTIVNSGGENSAKKEKFRDNKGEFFLTRNLT
jgi:hypothetical protein